MKNQIDFTKIVSLLKKRGINGINEDDFEEILHPSANNFLYKINKGKVRIILRVVHSLRDKDFNERSRLLFDLLSHKRGIPVPKNTWTGVVMCKDKKKRPFLIQDYIDAPNLREIITVYGDNPSKKQVEELNDYYRKISKILVKIHKIPVGNGAGLIINDKGKLRGIKESWYKHVQSLIFDALKRLQSSLKKKDYDKTKIKFVKMLEKYKEIIDTAPTSFLHGDPNPSNYLVDTKKKKIVGVVDFDFSAFGDSAFDIAKQPEEYLNAYISERKKVKSFDEKEFRLRVAIYEPITWLLGSAARLKKRPKSALVWFKKMNKVLDGVL